MESIFFLTNNSQTKFQDLQEHYGFKTYIKELDTFEFDLIGLVNFIR